MQTGHEGRFCSSDGRSWTDFATNRVSLRGISDSDAIGLMNGDLDFPVELVPSYMHETMHFSGFESPVGFCLARTYVTSLLGLAREVDHPWSSLLSKGSGEDTGTAIERADQELYRYIFVTEMLRPIAEGLALFAEFDTISRLSHLRDAGDRGVTSYALGTARQLRRVAAPEPGVGVDEMRRQIGSDLQSFRAGAAARDRKVGVFAMPIGRSGSGYLLGYLTIKNLWRKFETVPEFKNEPDLFLCFISDYFFRDWDLVELVMDGANDSEAFRRATTSHLISRFYTLMHEQWRLNLTDWAAGESGEHGRRLSINDGEFYGLDPVHSAATRKRFERYRVRSQAIRMREGLYELVEPLLWSTTERSFLTLGTLDVEVETYPGEVRIWRGQREFSVRRRDVVGHAKYLGTVDVFVHMRQDETGRLCVLSRDGRVVTSWVIATHEYEAAAIERAASDFTPTFQKDRRAWEQFLSEVEPRMFRSKHRSGAVDIDWDTEWFDCYAPWALWPLVGKKVREGYDVMRQWGLLSVPGCDPESLQTLARIGLLQSTSPDGYCDPSVIDGVGDGGTDVLERLLQSPGPSGIGLVSVSSAGLRALI